MSEDKKEDPNNNPAPVDDYFEDENGEGFLTADHPLLAKVQEALKKQLTTEHARVDLQVKEKTAEYKKVEADREEIGVRLYATQHALAKTQLEYEKIQDAVNEHIKKREEEEKNRGELKTKHEQKKVDIETLTQKVNKAQEELNQLNRTLRQVEDYNTQMKKEMIVIKRNTYKAEENVTNVEKDKKKQDLLIDQMNDDVKRLDEQKAFYHAQLLSQKEETENARKTLKQAAVEIENIIAQKQKMIAEWQKSLIAIQKRDKVLQFVKDVDNQYEEQTKQLDVEISGLENADRKEQMTQSDLENEIQEKTAQISSIEGQIQEKDMTEKNLKEEMDMLKKSIQATENENKRMISEKEDVEGKMRMLDKTIMQIAQDIKKLDDDLHNKDSEQKTLAKSATNLKKQSDSIKLKMFEKEIELNNLNNEIGRVLIDIINSKSQNEILGKQLEDLSKDLAKKTSEEKEKQDDLKKNEEAIAKKQKIVDKLNRTYGGIMDKNGSQKTGGTNNKDEILGPLETEKLKLIKEKSDMDSQCIALRAEWIKKQTNVLTLQQTKDEDAKGLDLLKNQKVILEQKKMREEKNTEMIIKDTRDIDMALKGLRNEMNKLNVLLSKHQENKKILEDQNSNSEKEFYTRLKQLESEGIELEKKIQALRDEKSDILTQIVETERQILLWERKTELEKEMQKELDPNIGRKEIEMMKNEIHNMELRFQQMKRKQEELIKDMERCVAKRETIQWKYLPLAEKQAKGSKVSASKMQRDIQTLKATLKHTTDNAAQITKSIEEKAKDLEKLNSTTDGTAQKLRVAEENIGKKQIDLLSMQIEKQVGLSQILSFQGKAKILDAVSKGKYKEKGAKEKDLEEDIIKALDQFKMDHPMFALVIDKVMA